MTQDTVRVKVQNPARPMTERRLISKSSLWCKTPCEQRARLENTLQKSSTEWWGTTGSFNTKWLNRYLYLYKSHKTIKITSASCVFNKALMSLSAKKVFFSPHNFTSSATPFTPILVQKLQFCLRLRWISTGPSKVHARCIDQKTLPSSYLRRSPTLQFCCKKPDKQEIGSHFKIKAFYILYLRWRAYDVAQTDQCKSNINSNLDWDSLRAKSEYLGPIFSLLQQHCVAFLNKYGEFMSLNLSEVQWFSQN